MYAYRVDTKKQPPTMFPRVTGIRFFSMKPIQFRFAVFSPTCDTNPGTSFSIIPMGTKNMFATLCSYPLPTNAMIGKMHARIFPDVLSAEAAIHTERHTSQLHAIPL